MRLTQPAIYSFIILLPGHTDLCILVSTLLLTSRHTSVNSVIQYQLQPDILGAFSATSVVLFVYRYLTTLSGLYYIKSNNKVIHIYESIQKKAEKA